MFSQAEVAAQEAAAPTTAPTKPGAEKPITPKAGAAKPKGPENEKK